MCDPLLAKAVLFDFDGTLTEPGAINFSEIKKAIHCPADKPILEHIELMDENEQKQARSILQHHEMEAAARSMPNRGAEFCLRSLKKKQIPFGILTRNSLQAVERAIQNFRSVKIGDFYITITRESVVRPKPSPEGVLYAARSFGVKPQQLLFIGDYLFDIQAGRDAGAVTVLLSERETCCNIPIKPDYVITCLGLLLPLLQGRD